MGSWCLPFFTFNLQNIFLHSIGIYQTGSLQNRGNLALGQRLSSVSFYNKYEHVKGAIVVFLFITAEMLVRNGGRKQKTRKGWMFWCRDGTRPIHGLGYLTRPEDQFEN